MRHWTNIRQEGDYWCGEFETDDTDWRLAELIVTIQYACQRHYFGALAEKYFDDKTRDAAANVQRRGKTIEAYSTGVGIIMKEISDRSAVWATRIIED